MPRRPSNTLSVAVNPLTLQPYPNRNQRIFAKTGGRGYNANYQAIASGDLVRMTNRSGGHMSLAEASHLARLEREAHESNSIFPNRATLPPNYVRPEPAAILHRRPQRGPHNNARFGMMQHPAAQATPPPKPPRNRPGFVPLPPPKPLRTRKVSVPTRHETRTVYGFRPLPPLSTTNAPQPLKRKTTSTIPGASAHVKRLTKARNSKQ